MGTVNAIQLASLAGPAAGLLAIASLLFGPAAITCIPDAPPFWRRRLRLLCLFHSQPGSDRSRRQLPLQISHEFRWFWQPEREGSYRALGKEGNSDIIGALGRVCLSRPWIYAELDFGLWKSHSGLPRALDSKGGGLNEGKHAISTRPSHLLPI